MILLVLLIRHWLGCWTLSKIVYCPDPLRAIQLNIRMVKISLLASVGLYSHGNETSWENPYKIQIISRHPLYLISHIYLINLYLTAPKNQHWASRL